MKYVKESLFRLLSSAIVIPFALALCYLVGRIYVESLQRESVPDAELVVIGSLLLGFVALLSKVFSAISEVSGFLKSKFDSQWNQDAEVSISQDLNDGQNG